jgi:hypothetical protein
LLRSIHGTNEYIVGFPKRDVIVNKNTSATGSRSILRYFKAFIQIGGVFAVLCVPFALAAFGVQALLPSLVGSAAFGATLTVLLALADQVGRLSGTGISRSMSPQQKIEIHSNASPEQIDHALKEVLARLSVKTDSIIQKKGLLLADTGFSLRSFGENIAITVRAVQGGHAVIVSSRPRVASTLIDYGKGRHNVNEIARAISSLDEAGPNGQIDGE